MNTNPLRTLNVFAAATTLMLAATAAWAQTPIYNEITSLNPLAYWPLQETAAPPLADVETNLGSVGATADAFYSSTNVYRNLNGVAAGYTCVSNTTTTGSCLAVPVNYPGVTLPVGSFSVEAWVYPSTTSASTIIAQTGPAGSGGLNATTNSAGWSLNQTYIPSTGSSATTCWSFHVYNGVGVGGAEAVVATNFVAGKWYYLVGTYDGSHARIYLNGADATTSSNIMTGTQAQDTWDLLTIGCGRGLNNNLFAGQIEDVAIETGANSLTPGQIATRFASTNSSSSSAYQAAVLANSPVMYYRMNAPFNIAQSSYPVANNAGSLANENGLYSSGTFPGLAGPQFAGFTNNSTASYACGFNGLGSDSTNLVTLFTNGVPIASQTINAGVIVTNLNLALDPFTNSFSYLYWFQTTPMWDARNGCFGHGDSSWRSSLLPSGLNGTVTANNGKSGDLATPTTLNFNDGNWHLVVLTYTNTYVIGNGGAGWSATNQLYVDGVLQSSVYDTNLIGSVVNRGAGPSVAADGGPITTNILIGGAPDHVVSGNGGVYSDQALSGSMAHVAFFNYALTPAQIQAVYTAGGEPPVIQTQPAASVAGTVQGTSTFSVSISGASTLVYQWYYTNNGTVSALSDMTLGDGSVVSGSGTNILTISNLHTNDVGYYFAVVTNNYGSVTSILSQLTISGAAPVITAQGPTNSAGAYVGQDLSFYVTASGASPLSYQWYTNGVPDMTGGATPNYTFIVQAGQTTPETVYCIVTNIYGSVQGSNTTLTSVSSLPSWANGNFEANVLGLNPVGYWPLQETNPPPSAIVESNLGSLGPIANAYYMSTNVTDNYYIQGTNGGIGGDNYGSIGAQFDASGSSAGSFMAVPSTYPQVALTPGQPFSVELWVYIDNYNWPITGQTTAGLIGQCGPATTAGLNSVTNAAGWSLNLNYQPRYVNQSQATSSGLQGFSFHVFNGQGLGGGAEADAGNLFATNVWYHIVGVFDGNNCWVYVDGSNNTTFQQPISGSFTPDTWDPLEMGALHGINASTPPSNLKGGMLDVAIYNYALSPTQITNDYNYGYFNPLGSGSAYTNLVFTANHPIMFWQMNAGQFVVPPASTYPIATNYGSISSGGTLASSPYYGLYQPGTTPGMPGPQFPGLGNATNACAFNGLNSAVMVWTNNNTVFTGFPTTGGLNPSNQSVSVLCWFKGNPADTDGRFQGLVGHGNNAWRLAVDTSGHLHWNANNSGDLISSNLYNDGGWHLAVGTYANFGGNNGSNYLYVDGRLDTSVTNYFSQVGAITNFGVTIGGAADTAYTCPDLGFYSSSVPNATNGYNTGQRYFAGSLAHVAFFNTALSAAQVLNLYTNAVPNTAPSILLQPLSAAVIGGTGTFDSEYVVANGTPTLGYNWYYNTSSNYVGATALANGAKYSFAQTAQVTITNLMNSDSGYYFVVVTNNYGSATSAIANVSVAASPVLTLQYPNGTFSMFTNQSTILSVQANGSQPINYLWYTNAGNSGFSADYAGSVNGSNYTVSAQGAAVGEQYYCQVFNLYGSTNSVTNTLTALNPLPAALLNSPYGSAMLALNPVGYWPMHENEPQPFIGDIETNYGTLGPIGNGYYQDWAQPYVQHNVPGAIAGSSDPAVLFGDYANGGVSDDDLVVPHWNQSLTVGANSGPFALESWILPLSSGGNADGDSYWVIIGQGLDTLNGVGVSAGFAMQLGGTLNCFSIVVQGLNGGNWEQKTLPVYTPGTWYHLFVYWSGNTNYYYVNGQLASVQLPQAIDANPAMNPDTWDPLTIGGGRWGTTGASHGFPGAIDEVAIYTNITTVNQAAQVAAQDYAAGRSASSNYFQTILNNQPILYYRMDSAPYVAPSNNGTYPVLTNYGTVARNGVYVPSAVPGSAMGPNAAGVVSTNFMGTNAFGGNGVMSFADAGIVPQWDPVTTNAFSYTAWFKGRPQDERSFAMIMSANDSTWRNHINSGGGQLVVHGNGNNDETAGNLKVNDGNWHQFIEVCQPMYTNGVWNNNMSNSIYIDGQLVYSLGSTGTNTPNASGVAREVLLGDETGVHTNCIADGNGGRSWAGDMCEAAFFNYALNSAQAMSLYTAASIAPTIEVQPSSAIAVVTLAYSNTIVAVGSGTLNFQWYTVPTNNSYANSAAVPAGGNITGQSFATTSIATNYLFFSPVQFNNATNYYCIVTNNYGAVTSSIVTLSVLGVPTITNQVPVTYSNAYLSWNGAATVTNATIMTLFSNVSPTFTVQAIGAPPLGYYWYTNGIPDKAVVNTATTFKWPNVRVVFTNYCVVSNVLGSVTSLVWQATIVPDPTNSYPAAVLADNPAAYWRLDETNPADTSEPDSGPNNGILAIDYAGGNNGIYTNMILGEQGYDPATDPTELAASFAQYAQKNSAACSIMAPDETLAFGNNAEFTVSAWINPFEPETTTAGIVAKGQFNQEEYDMDCGGTSETLRFSCRDSSGNIYNAIYTNSSLSALLNQFYGWTHVVGVMDQANSNMSLYVNGGLAMSVSIVPGVGIYNSSATPISIGSRSSQNPSYTFGDNDQQFSGYINDLAIFNYAMTNLQVLNLYLASGNVPPYFLTQPTATNFTSAGSSIVLSPPLTVAGSSPLQYWWSYLQGGNIVSNIVSGVTNVLTFNAGSFVITNVPAFWNGNQLRFAVSNAYGGTNITINLVVSSSPVITTNLPASLGLVNGRYYTFTPGVIGSMPLGYQWYSNNPASGSGFVGLSGATNSTYSFTAAGPSTNQYYFTVTNQYGEAISATSTVTVFSSYQAEILASGPALYWPLSETPDNGSGDDGTVAHDLSGNGNNGFYTNALIGVPGLPGDPFSVGQFGSPNVTPSMVEELGSAAVPDMSQVAQGNGNNAEFTVEAWCAPTTGNALNARIVDCGHFFQEEWALDLGTTTPGEAFRFTLRGADSTEYDARSSIVPDGNWHFIVGVCDEANGQMYLYVDGQLAANNNFDTGFASGKGIEEDAQPITVGAADTSSTGTYSYGAQLISKISDVAIYTSVLSASQILAQYQSVTAGVYPIPSVTQQLPLPQTSPFTLYQGVSPTFLAIASGVPPLAYQWYSNNVAVANATNTTFTINNIGIGSYTNYCIITNAEGTGTSMVWNASVVADPTTPFVATILSNNPVAFWPLNEPFGSALANDYAGGANGVYGANMTAGLPGAPGSGLGNASSAQPNSGVTTVSYGCIASSGVVLNTNTVTLLSWINLSTGNEVNPSGIIFCRSGNTVAGDQIGGSPGDVLDYTWNSLPTTYDYGSGLAMSPNTWYLTAMTTTPTNTILYVIGTNGLQSATNNVGNANQSFYGGLDLGADSLTTNRIFQGEMQDAAIFNYTLSVAQLQQLYFAATNLVSSISFTNGPKIGFTLLNNNQFGINWPSNYVGYYYLQVQTNSITTGISNNWVPYNGSIAQTLNANGITNTMPGGKICVFYRLMTNAP